MFPNDFLLLVDRYNKCDRLDKARLVYYAVTLSRVIFDPYCGIYRFFARFIRLSSVNALFFSRVCTSLLY